MPMKVYMSGTLVTTSAQFTDRTGAAATPTTTTLKYRKDAGAVTTVLYPAAPIIQDGTGAFHADLDTTGWAGPGNQTWTVEWIGTGNVQVPGADVWQVEPLAL